MDYSRSFYGHIADGKIYSYGGPEGQVCIGVANDIYDNLKKEFDALEKNYYEYQSILIEQGLVEVPKTQEQINGMILSEIKEIREAQKQFVQMAEILQAKLDASPVAGAE